MHGGSNVGWHEPFSLLLRRVNQRPRDSKSQVYARRVVPAFPVYVFRPAAFLDLVGFNDVADPLLRKDGVVSDYPPRGELDDVPNYTGVTSNCSTTRLGTIKNQVREIGKNFFGEDALIVS